MGLAERLGEPNPNKGGRPCPICRLLASGVLPDDDQAALEFALATNAKQGGWSAREITEGLKAEGHPINKSTVELHRIEHMKQTA